MEYNTRREKLKIPDYGRSVCKLIEFAKTVQDRTKRNQIANIIVNVMSQVNPTVKETADYKHKLWDHMMIIANYELDVDCPYEITRESASVDFVPKALKYSKHRIRYRHYGKIMENLVEKVSTYPDGEEKDYLVELIAQQLKKSYLLWNRDSVNDDLIASQFRDMSKGALKLSDDFQFVSTKECLAQLEKPVDAVVITPNTQPAKKKKAAPQPQRHGKNKSKAQGKNKKAHA
ncbi:MAG: DUF4290 domain-containing protein [Bacteroidales bacterium]|nr:DUF4290 domain-containing protein [Bacteroidales bacterium]